ncbi:hypothetical protein ACWF94_31620 [Streptomyces sp. NPDC055078]
MSPRSVVKRAMWLEVGESGWCHWHGGPSGTARTIHLIERASGLSYAQTACAPCREQRGLIALVDHVPGELLWSV